MKIASILERVSETDRLAGYLDNDLVPDPVCKAAFGNPSDMTWWRWEHDPQLNFPKAVSLRRRKFRRAGDVRRFRKERFGF